MNSTKQAEYDRKDHERLHKTINKVENLLHLYSNIYILQCSYAGSHQIQKIRKLLRTVADIVRGKVTHLRTAIAHQLSTHPKLKPLLQHIRGEIGLIFTNKDPLYIQQLIDTETAATHARLNVRTPNDIIIPYGPTILEPTQTSYISLLNIPTKILHGKVFVCNDTKIYQKGEIITEPGFHFMNRLRMKPILIRVIISHAYIDGVIIDEKTLNEAEERLERSLHDGIQNIAAISVAIGAANKSSMMYILHSGLMNIKALSTGLNVQNF